MRCDYLMATLNPDDPNLLVYKEYVNCSRPLPEWADSTPQEIKDELKEEIRKQKEHYKTLIWCYNIFSKIFDISSAASFAFS